MSLILLWGNLQWTDNHDRYFVFCKLTTICCKIKKKWSFPNMILTGYEYKILALNPFLLLIFTYINYVWRVFTDTFLLSTGQFPVVISYFSYKKTKTNPNHQFDVNNQLTPNNRPIVKTHCPPKQKIARYWLRIIIRVYFPNTNHFYI